MNIFYNYNLNDMCSALQMISSNETLCPGAEVDCVQKNLFVYMNGNLIYFWLHFDESAKTFFYDHCDMLEGFDVEELLFDEAFDFDPSVLVNATQNANSTVNSTQSG